jgi:predicted lipid-binding transport protein (Tim44 family)
MPLSEHEQRLLAQMEQALYAEDPTFANNLRTTSAGRASRGRAAFGVLAVLGGMGLVLAGVATMIIALGVVGFVVMLIGAVVAFSAFNAPAVVSGAAEGEPAKPAAKPAKPGFMDRMEERWRERNGE